ncbi:MAG: spore coat U domain-containing protein [Rhodocyclaceae bacterium]|nr:spore coat U domain-containing protein [Rhodocyclaceae bacterium]
MRHIREVSAVVVLMLFAQAASAGTASGTFAVTATVSATCSVVTSDVNFGTYSPASVTAATASGAVTATCTSGTAYTIALDAGANAGGVSAFSNRNMASGANLLPYQLYLDAGYATVWGDGTSSSSVNPATGSFSGNGSAQDHTVYGKVTPGHYVAPGSYTDTVTVTVTY